MESRGTALLVDDDNSVRALLSEVLDDDGFDVESAATAEDALEKLSKADFDVVITDVRMRGMDGLQLQEKIRAQNEHVEVVIITAFGDIPMSVQAMKQGAFEFLTKPFKSVDHVVLVARRAAEKAQMAKKIEKLMESLEKRDHLDKLIGSSSPMQEVYRRIAHLAKTDSTVLLLGETGTGKEMTVRAIHSLGARKKAPFVAVNCGSLPESLLESELFGHSKGSFTGASTSKLGLFASASGGSILLDEIEAAKEGTQIALLRVLDSKEIRPIGSNTPQKVDVRVFAASNENLETLVEEGSFRKDLYYRLISAIITLPPLRERRSDLPMLAEYFLKLYSQTHDRQHKRLSRKASELLMKYDWPGNVRELKHAMEHGVIFSSGPTIGPKDLPEAISAAGKQNDRVFVTLEKLERDHIAKALRMSAFNIAKAARLLGLTRQSLYRKMEHHQISQAPDRPEADTFDERKDLD
ncbi:MAG: sigma-54-dependent Fis family transcriptional regulator [Candidatus Coatesbacteria bacterium]|nr:sigma-54-dependent Fis family transcriptional regulator [Candidatus Coatesbacteria bacterium]